MESQSRGPTLVSNARAWDQYNFYTGELTRHARGLGFAGVAICWILRDGEAVNFPLTILLGLFTFVLYFLLDGGQYAHAAWKLRRRIEEREQELESTTGSREGDYSVPRAFDKPIRRYFIAKLVALLIAFLFVGAGLMWQMLK
jgi:hypothetical protein